MTIVAPEWLVLKRLAHVEASSEDDAHPIESAFSPQSGIGWRASAPGEQVIRVRFREPRSLSRIRLVFVEEEHQRTQQFTLRCSFHRGETHRDIVRQKFNFSPSGATRETEEYRVDLHDVGELDLRIVPDITGRAAIAALAECWLR